MLSPFAKKIVTNLPEGLMVYLGKKITDGYIKKYANLKIEGYDEIKDIKGPILFICNHLSNADGLLLNRLLKKDFDPYFIAGKKLSDDPITNIGTKMVKNIPISPNSADKEAMTKMVKTLKNGENILIFPEGTRSRTGAMIEAKKGILLLTRMSKATIIPIGVTGSQNLLPIAKDSDMGGEKWTYADVTIRFGNPVIIDKKEKDEDKHEYDNKCMTKMMKSIANLLPESYRGIYK